MDPIMAALYEQTEFVRRFVGPMRQLYGEQTTLFSSTRRGKLWKWLSPTGGGAATQFGPDCVLDYLRCSFAFCVGLNRSFFPNRG